MRHPLTLVIALLVALVVATACTDSLNTISLPEDQPGSSSTDDDGPTADGSDDPDDADGSDGSEAVSAVAGEVGEYVVGECGFDIPADTEPACGTLTVPMNWDSGEGEVALAVAVFPSTSPTPAPDPVVYLEGGPGGHALETIAFSHDDLLQPLAERGDVIFFDQRGAGLSSPRLDCTEVTELTRELESQADVDIEAADEMYLEALGACGDRFIAAGVDLGAFNSVNNAHDVNALREALGYEEWNLLGISYGTKLALEVMRQHPDGVRSVVLDSVFPPQVDSVLENPTTFLDSYDAVVAACAAEPECAAGGPLDDRLEAAIQVYDEEPVLIEVTDFLAGETSEVYVDGESIVGLITSGLYSPSSFTDFPELVTELEAGETRALEAYFSQERTNEPFFSSGMFYAFDCNEEVPFADLDEVSAALPPDPFGLRDGFDYSSNNGTNGFRTCEAFGSTPGPPVLDEQVTSDIPSLVMAGRYDPVTPVAWAELAATTLSNSFVVVDEFDSHGVSPGDCGMAVVRQFLDDPGSQPDASCFADDTFTFLAPPDDDVELEEVEVEPFGGVALSTLRPSEWDHGDIPGDSYRQNSMLDPTVLLQFDRRLVSVPAVEEFLLESADVVVDEAVTTRDVGGKTWRHRTGSSDWAVVDWYETEIDGEEILVILTSARGEEESNRAVVLEPVLEAIDLA